MKWVFNKFNNAVKANRFSIKPRNQNDYYTVFGWMISKRLAFAIVIFLGAISITYIVIMKPLNIMGSSRQGAVGITYRYNSIPLRFYSGQVKILGKSGYLAYEGNIKDGVVTGMGKLYGKAGNLIYEGEFDKNMYNGTGKLYYDNEVLRYEGGFIDNEFSGSGTLYRENGIKEYTGDFLQNEKNGTGELFDESGNLVFTGNFSNGKILYSDFLGKTAGEISKLYSGSRIVYTDDREFGIGMPDINAVYWGMSGADKLNDEYTVGGVLVLESAFWIQKNTFTRIAQMKEYFGEPIYEGNTNLTLMECVVVNQLIDKGSGDFEKIEMKNDSSFTDMVHVTEYDKTREIYIYTFQNNGLLYTFYCTEKNEKFFFWKCEALTGVFE